MEDRGKVGRNNSTLQLRISRDVRALIPKRYVLAILCFLAFFLAGWMRMNFNRTVVFPLRWSMLRKDGVSFEITKNWTETEVPWVERSFSLGYAAGLIPSALLTLIFSSKRVMAASMAICSLLHIITPVTLHFHVHAVICLCALTGFAEAALFPACVGLWVQWAPPSERSRLVALAFCSAYLAQLINVSTTSHFIGPVDADVAFYVVGVAGLAWCLLWLWLAYESPSSNPTITQKELLFLQKSISPDINIAISVKSIPIKLILTSVPMWALCVAHLTYIHFSRLSVFQFYMIDNFDEYFLVNIMYGWGPLLILLPASGLLADVLINKNILSVGCTRKMFISGATTLTIVVYVTSALQVESRSVGTCITFLLVAIVGLGITALTANCLDIGSRYAVIIVAAAQMLATLHTIALYKFFEFVIDYIQWILLAECITCILVYGIFGSGDLQHWAMPTTTMTPGSAAGGQNYAKPTDEEEDDLITDTV